MNTEKLSKEEKLEYFKKLYENAKNGYSPNLDAFERYMNQYKGSSELDGSENRAVTVRNITYEMIESQVSSDIPPPKVDTACYSERRSRCAKSIERLLYSVRDKLRYEEMNDIDERYTYIYGGSVWYAEWDNEIRLGKEIGGVRLYCLPPRCFIPQPAVYNVQDMEYCFLHFTTTRGELVSKYGIDEDKLALAECEYIADVDDPLGDAVAIVITFYKDTDGRVGKFVFSGELALSDMPDYYKRKKVVCRQCGKDEAECECEKPKLEICDVDYESITLQDGSPAQIPYYVPRSFPIVVRKNTLSDITMLGGSDCERIRPQQQAINKVESRILQKLLRAGVTPIMPEGTAVTLSNAIFGQVIKTRPGESINSYGKIDTTPDISQDIEEADRLYDQAKRVLGISDALQGLDATTSESGYARQLKIARASSRLETKKRMKHLAYCRIYELIFKHYLAFADEPRRFSYRDTFGRMHFTEFNRYDFIEQDKNGNYYYDDSYLFTVDNQADAQYQSEALWEINLQNLERGTLGDKESPTTLMRYWQLQDKAHFPYARENVEYFQDIINRESGVADNASPSISRTDKIPTQEIIQIKKGS